MPTQKEVFLKLMEGGLVEVLLNSARPDVELPAHLMGSPFVKLNWSYAFNIPDLAVDDRTLAGTLTFDQTPFACVVPWDAIYGMGCPTTGGTAVWPRLVPPDFIAHLIKSACLAAPPVPATPKKRSPLTLVRSEEA